MQICFSSDYLIVFSSSAIASRTNDRICINEFTIWLCAHGHIRRDYQSEGMIDYGIAECIALDHKNKEIADQYFSAIQGDEADRYFVHVRRGDYVYWPNRESPAVLPLGWSRAQMNRIRGRNTNAQFIVVSDDKPYVDEFFSNEKDVVIACSDMIGDFSVMTKCLGGGVLSASSLSWWASYFIRRDNPDALFIAPRYWAGSRNKKWFPECICTSWINYEDAF